jgi:hypothetical protein
MYEIHKLFKISTRVYFCKLRLKGLGFRALKITKGLYRFFFNQTNFFYFFAPSSILIIFKKRVLFFFGINFNILRITIAHLLLLKQLTMYRTRGLIYTRQIRILKPGKKRF